MTTPSDLTRTIDDSVPETQSMRGFEDGYTDIVDYIVRSTHRIWEEKGMGLLYSHYRHNVQVHTAYGLTYGREAMLAASIQKLAAYPDRKAYADEVIWAGDDEQGFRTSHRITTVARNTGYSLYGPPTGREVAYLTIANCLVRENRIVEEWLVTDELAVVRQLGIDERDAALTLARRHAARRPRWPTSGDPERLKGQTGPTVMPPRDGAGFDVEDFVRRTFHELWNWRLFNVVDDCYAPNYRCHITADRDLHGAGQFRAWVIAMIAVFPDAVLHVDDLYWLPDGANGYRTATRWTLSGTHAGYGAYGEPTGRRVVVMGITHHLIRDERFVEEWTVFDELAIRAQLCDLPDA